MSKNEKKSSLADLLEEYFPGAGREAEQVLKDRFGGAADEGERETDVPEEKVPDEIASEDVEIISLEDGDEEDGTEDIPDEPFEVPEETEEDELPKAEEFSTLSQWSDWADETIAASAAAGTFAGTADETAAKTAEDTETETAEAENAPEGEEAAAENKAETEAEDADKEKVHEKEDVTENVQKEEITENEDINEKWLVRFAKGIFPVKGDSVFEVIRKIIFLAAIIVFIGAGIMLASTLIQSKAAVEMQSSMRDIIETTVASYIDEKGEVQTIPPTKEEQQQHNSEVVESFKEVKDYIGYLELAGCEIFDPVVQGEDNDYYLKNNVYGEPNKAGALFMDYRCTVTPEYTSPNIVIYGHNQEDGTMFGHLKYYKVDYSIDNPNANFYKYNPVIKFNPEFETNEYLIYAFFVTNALENQDSNGEVFHYHDYIESLNDEYTFNWYQGEVQKRNQIISPVDVRYGDKLLVLSTCSNEFTNSRFVVFARKLREGESVSDYDFSETRLNPNPQGVDWEAIMSGETSATEVPETEEELDETTTRKKSLNKRNEKTYTTASEEEAAVTEAPAETRAEVTTVPESETSETETETAGSSEEDGTETEDSGSESETTVRTDENGETVPETDENGETVTYSDSESETSESVTEEETTAKKKRKKSSETSETSEAVTSKKKSKKSNR